MVGTQGAVRCYKDRCRCSNSWSTLHDCPVSATCRTTVWQPGIQKRAKEHTSVSALAERTPEYGHDAERNGASSWIVVSEAVPDCKRRWLDITPYREDTYTGGRSSMPTSVAKVRHHSICALARCEMIRIAD